MSEAPLVLAIVGTRERSLRREVEARITAELERALQAGTQIVTGDCPTGVDATVRIQCHGRLVVSVVFAPWEYRGRLAGPIRNQSIARIGDRCLAFPERDEVATGSGTWDCIRAFERVGKPVEIFGEWKRK